MKEHKDHTCKDCGEKCNNDVHHEKHMKGKAVKKALDKGEGKKELFGKEKKEEKEADEEDEYKGKKDKE